MEILKTIEKTKVKKVLKSHMKWSYLVMLMFLTLGIIDIRFGILGFACMGAPVYHSVRGRGKIHCQKYCPRGSLLARALESISLKNKLPKFMASKKFKNGLLTAMLVLFTFSMYHAGLNFNRIAFAMFRFMSMSLLVGIITGVIFKPRSWCVVCPMGHAAGLIDTNFVNKKPKVSKDVYTGSPQVELVVDHKKAS
jgi:hypothetical protein